MGLLRLVLPAIREWWKSKKFSQKSNRALREINQIFAMHVLVFILFFASIEHGVSIYSYHTEKLRDAAFVRRDLDFAVERNVTLQAENAFLKDRYTKVVKALEFYAKEDAYVVLRRLEDAGVINPVSGGQHVEPKPR